MGTVSWLPDLLDLPYIYHKQRGHFPLINHTRDDIAMKKRG